MATTESTPDASEVVLRLGELIEVDAEVGEGFGVASELAQDSRIRAVLTRAWLQRQRFVHELQSEMRELGGDPNLVERRVGHLHRSWLALHTASREHDLPGAIAACARGDVQTLDAYRAIIAAGLPLRTRALLRRQELEIEMLHGALESLGAELEHRVAS